MATRKPQPPIVLTLAERRAKLAEKIADAITGFDYGLNREITRQQKECAEWGETFAKDPLYALDWVHKAWYAAGKLAAVQWLVEARKAEPDFDKLFALAQREVVQRACWMLGQNVDEAKARFASALADQTRDLGQFVGYLNGGRAELAELDAQLA